MPRGEGWDERARTALAVMLPTSRHRRRTTTATLVRHPDLTGSFLAFNSRMLLRSALPPGRRELAILRVARRHRAGRGHLVLTERKR
jgi:4-carboxymuconolactone decarboxylase